YTQLNDRLSQDLAFCKWVPVSNGAHAIEAKTIKKELKEKLGEDKINKLSFDQVDLYAQGVQLTFFNDVGYNVAAFESNPVIVNINCVPLNVVSSMKMKTMFERNAFRDYYDIFVLVKEIVTFQQLIQASISYHSKLKEQMIINRLLRWQQVDEESGFIHLNPRYPVGRKEIGEFFKSLERQKPF